MPAEEGTYPSRSKEQAAALLRRVSEIAITSTMRSHNLQRRFRENPEGTSTEVLVEFCAHFSELIPEVISEGLQPQEE